MNAFIPYIIIPFAKIISETKFPRGLSCGTYFRLRKYNTHQRDGWRIVLIFASKIERDEPPYKHVQQN